MRDETSRVIKHTGNFCLWNPFKSHKWSYKGFCDRLGLWSKYDE